MDSKGRGNHRIGEPNDSGGVPVERTFSLNPLDAEVVFHALRYYAADLGDALLDDDESPLLADAAAAHEIAQRLQVWLVANRQSLLRDPSG